MDNKGVWWSDASVYHTLRTAISSELAPFLHGHISWLIRNRTDKTELIERLQALEQMLLDAPQKDWILKECKSIMFWDPPVAEDHASDEESAEKADEVMTETRTQAPKETVKIEAASPYSFYI